MRSAVNALDAGLTLSDLKHMKYTHVMLFLYERDDAMGAEVDEVREATADDVNWLKSL